MAGDTTPDAFVPSAYLNGFIVYPGAVSQILKTSSDQQHDFSHSCFFILHKMIEHIVYKIYYSSFCFDASVDFVFPY